MILFNDTDINHIKFSNETNPEYVKLIQQRNNYVYNELDVENKKNYLNLNYIRNSKLGLIFEKDQHKDEIIKCLIGCNNLENKFIYNTSFRDVLNSVNDINWLVDEVIYYKSIALQNGKKFIFMVDSVTEAPTYIENLKKNLDLLSEKTNIPLKDFLIFSPAAHECNYVKTSYFPGIAFGYSNIYKKNCEILPNYHFISLARVPREHRIISTIEIIRRGLEQYGNMSLGSGDYGEPMETAVNRDLSNLMPYQYRKYFCVTIQEQYKDKFPMYIDGEILTTDPIMMTTSNEKITTAFVNFVMETAFERGLGVLSSWQTVLISEKSIKPFAYGQVPIFVSYYQQLKYLRKFGFDLFDDIIDHSYDNEPDPLLRIKLCVDQLEKICQWSLEDCRKFKQDNMHRFVNNQKILMLWERYYWLIGTHYLQNALDSYDK
jgi:hypothetical protein